ncbi:response regulator transcription factor [Helicobacter winghamensis]|uniref:Two-component system response regulator n=1 Tax=Helicobacter winghamensis TaxID=157268 RepID=A0A2N3PHM9_9HELI|nr:response regulator transcription factor [Helicobacter winghamensis]EEO25504.1 putative transcriptional regulatory protein RprY [Helicobacter winghamensis ATCC BAA-430]PKT78074.1 two-component system response regulator [Helicobacter winghamensis]PKT78339.1 two-component system response regulator [Helicobacter winghamensis]PKT78602.1 two-component system response regulator [Helicobacter winghamensis]PKT80069.1 two-component system response regulator [Helicobacter winghamensis]
MKAKVLLLEDDVALQEIIAECLEEEGYFVVCCDNGLEAANKAYEMDFDILLLDVMVAGQNGFKALREIRESGKDTPAIFITALNSLKDLEVGFKSGCDDYLRKPFELSELLLRIEAQLKRKGKNTLFDFGNGYCFDSKTEILYFENKIQKMPSKERELLKLLLKHNGEFVSLEQIYSVLWGYDEEPSELSLRVYIKNLRHIVGKDNILTRRGEGYCYKRA